MFIEIWDEKTDSIELINVNRVDSITFTPSKKRLIIIHCNQNQENSTELYGDYAETVYKEVRDLIRFNTYLDTIFQKDKLDELRKIFDKDEK